MAEKSPSRKEQDNDTDGDEAMARLLQDQLLTEQNDSDAQLAQRLQKKERSKQDGGESLVKKSEKEESKIANALKKYGLQGIKRIIEEKLNGWKNIKLNIGVTGDTGVGKSKFVNAVRGLTPGDEGLAETDVIETTAVAEAYPHPDNPNLVIYDLPGVGSPNFKRENYCSDKRIGFDNYDAYIIIISTRVREDDMWLAQEIKSRNKKFIFVRSKVEADIRNAKREHKINDDEKLNVVVEFEKNVIKKIRNNCTTQLKKHKLFDGAGSEVFLIDSFETEHPCLDFDKLVNRIHDSFEGLKQDAFTLTISKNASFLIEEKRKLLINRTYWIALTSAVGAVLPIPGVSAVVDIALIRKEFMFYRKQFGIDDNMMNSIASATKQTPHQLGIVSGLTVDVTKGVGNALVLSAIEKALASESIEEAAKYALPVIGSFIGGAVSYGSTVCILKGLINALADDGTKVNTYYSEWLIGCFGKF